MQTLKSGKQSFNDLISQAQSAGETALPVERWHPESCGEMDMVIRKDGSWWHEGSRITRPALVKLFSSVLRKDSDGHTYLVTPVEKIRIKVECAPFVAVRVDVQGAGQEQTLFFTTNVGDVVQAGPEHPIRVLTDETSLEPTPLIQVRGRLDALMSRPVFYELVERAEERQTSKGAELGVWSDGQFFALGPAGVHDV